MERSDVYIHAKDLGIDRGDETYQALVEELQSESPWPVQMLQAHFDRAYPHWDDLPTLSSSSPLSRLRGLKELVHSADSSEEGLRDLCTELKSNQLRLLCCGRADLQDECSFMLQILTHLAHAFLVERAAHAHAVEEAAQELERTRVAARAATQGARLAAAGEARGQIEDLAGRAEAQQSRADRLEREVLDARAMLEHLSDMENRLSVASRDAMQFKQLYENTLEELRLVKTQRAFLAVEHEVSQADAEELARRLKESRPDKIAPKVLSSVAVATQTPQFKVPASRAFPNVALAALLVRHASDAFGRLMPTFQMWRCALLLEQNEREASRLRSFAAGSVENINVSASKDFSRGALAALTFVGASNVSTILGECFVMWHCARLRCQNDQKTSALEARSRELEHESSRLALKTLEQEHEDHRLIAKSLEMENLASTLAVKSMALDRMADSGNDSLSRLGFGVDFADGGCSCDAAFPGRCCRALSVTVSQRDDQVRRAIAAENEVEKLSWRRSTSRRRAFFGLLVAVLLPLYLAFEVEPSISGGY